MEPNPNGKPSSDVIVPYLNADAITKRDPHTWIIDFPVNLSERECQGYASAFEYVRKLVYPLRQNHREPVQKKFWWRLARPCPDLLAKIQRLDRFLVTTIVSKYRLFVWRTVPTNPDHAVAAFISPDDFLFGVLHSRLHQVWSLAQGTQLEDRPRYTPTTCFETFPLPQPTADQEKAVADAARELNGLRERWLNPPEWTRVEVLEFPASVNGPWRRFIAASDGGAAASIRETDVGWTPRDLYEAERSVRLARDSAKAAVLLSQGIDTARYPRVAALNALCAKRLKKRTLTALYNERPAWLETAHRTLDLAVFAAYGWPSDLADDAILERLLGLNRERSGRAMEECPHGHKTDAKRS